MSRPCLQSAAFAAIHSLICFTSAEAAEKRPLAPEDTAAIRWCVSPAMSPDGALVAYVVVDWDDETSTPAARRSIIWLARTDGSRPPQAILSEHRRVSLPHWSPDGQLLAFLSPGSENTGHQQIFLFAPGRSTVTQLTELDDAVQSYAWSPDGKAIAFRAPSPAAGALDVDPIEVGKHLRNDTLWVVDVETRQTQQTTDDRQHIVAFSWSPDSRRFAVTQAPSADLDDIGLHTTLVTVDRDSGETARVLSERVGGGINIDWSPDGQTIAFPESTPKRIARRLALVPASGGQPRYLLDDFPGYPVDTLQWSADSRHLWVQAIEGTRNRLLRVSADDGAVERIAADVQNFWQFSTSRDGRAVALTAETGTNPPNIVVFVEGQASRRLTDMNPQLAELNLGDVREVTWTSRQDGRLIHGVLVTPSDCKPGEPRPTIVELHGGPQGHWWSGWLGTYLSRGQFFASHGYVVFLPNPRGSINQGVEFTEANFRDWGGGDYHDVMDGVDALVEQKIADSDRLAIGGTSYGGYLTAWATTQTNRFRAAVVDAGWTDAFTLNLTIDTSVPLRAYFGGDEFRNRALLQSRSPLTYIERCQTPTLVLHGEMDQRAPLAQGRAWHRGLTFLGVETEMVVYPREGHLLAERTHQLDVMRRVLRWYEEHLGAD